MKPHFCRLSVGIVTLFAVALTASSAVHAAEGAWVRVTLLEPAGVPWRVHINVLPPRGAPSNWFVGERGATTQPTDAKPQAAGRATDWVDLREALGEGVASVRFLFFDGEGKQPLAKVKATFDLSTARGDKAIVRSISDHDPGNVISLRIPADPEKDKKWLLSIREDTQRRFDEVRSWNMPDSPLPKRIWCMTGFRSNGQFYTDPAIAEMDFDIIRMLGMNGYWEQNGGQPGELRKMAQARDINRTTVYWRDVASPPPDPGGFVRLDYGGLTKYIDEVYRRANDNTRKAHPHGVPPEIVVDLMDEPAGHVFDGPEYQASFRTYCKDFRVSPDLFGKKSWDEVQAPRLNWWEFYKLREAIDENDLNARRLFYWAVRHWNYATAHLYALANAKTEEVAKDVVIGTRVNFGPPWWYDYGTYPRGIDAFEFGRQRSVTLGFNEDWIGLGSPRIPLEINTLLIDWSRAAARPAEPLLGSYITRDADRGSVKLRVFGCLARNAKIFDFYYYGPSYTHFDHWSDNASMAQGVGELIRDLGQVDEILWDARPPKAQVALLYSKSWPMWKTDDTEQVEQMMVYLALLHAGIPVDIVSNEQVMGRRLEESGYKVLYVVNESIPAFTLDPIKKWVDAGGHLWASGWAGMRDEYNTPTDAWDALLGFKDRSWKVTGDLARHGEIIKPDDWQRPVFAREVTGTRLTDDTHGKGAVHVAMTTVGKQYMDAAKVSEGEDKLAKAVLYPDGDPRRAITEAATNAGVIAPATTSVNQVLAYPLWAKDKGVVLLANYTGEPQQNVEVSFTSPVPVNKLRSLRSGEIKFEKDGDRFKAMVPVQDVTDILVVD